MESLWAHAKGRTILSTTIHHHLDSFVYLYLLWFSNGSSAVVHIYQSQGMNVTGPSVTSHSVLMSMTRWALVCHGDWFRTALSGRLTLTGCPSLQMLWLVHPSFAFLAHGQLRPQSRQNRNSSVIQSSETEAAVMNEAQGPPRPQQWPKPEILLWTCCWDSGIDLKKNIQNVWVLLLLQYSNCVVMTVLSEVIPLWITVAQSHVFELNRLVFDAAVLHYSKNNLISSFNLHHSGICRWYSWSCQKPPESC